MELKKELVQVILVAVLGSMLMGAIVGNIGVTLTYTAYYTQCDLYGNHACQLLGSHSGCIWSAQNNTCNYQHAEVGCQRLSKDQCMVEGPGEEKYCYYDSSADTCAFVHGWSSTYQGLFGSMPSLGAILGGFLTGGVLLRSGRRVSLMVAGVSGFVGAVIIMGGWASFSYTILCVGEVALGFARGIVPIVCPRYVREMSPRNHKDVVGVLFSIGLTLGIFCSALIGFGIDPSRWADSSLMNIHAGFYVLPGFLMILSVSVFAVGWYMDESTVVVEAQREQRQRGMGMRNVIGWWLGGCCGGIFTGEIRRGRTWKEVLLELRSPLFTGLVLAAAQNATGINSMMSYAPKITSSIGLDPLVGNTAVMGLNFIATIFSLLVVRHLKPSQMFLWMGAASALTCIVTGVPMLVGASQVQQVVSGIGIIAFIVTFAIGMGPSSHILASSTFPESIKDLGSTLVNVSKLIFGLLSRFLYPVVTEALSGGASGNQNQGKGICFVVFGVMTAICLLLLKGRLHDYSPVATDEEDIEGRERKPPVTEAGPGVCEMVEMLPVSSSGAVTPPPVMQSHPDEQQQDPSGSHVDEEESSSPEVVTARL